MVKKTIYFDVMLKSSDRINLNDFKARQKVMTNDKNSVDIVFRATDVEPDDLKGATASIFLYMQDGSFFQSNSVVITNNILTYTMTQNQTQHKGTTKVQIVVKSGTIDNASLLQEFEISPGLEKYPLTEVMIQDWTTLTAEAKAFVDQIEGFTLESFVELKMGEELANLEVNYAPRLTGLESNDASLTAQLAQKVGNGKLASMSDLGQDVKTAMTGGSVAVVGEGAVTKLNLANDVKKEIEDKVNIADELTNEHVLRVLPNGVRDHRVNMSIVKNTKYVELYGTEGWLVSVNGDFYNFRLPLNNLMNGEVERYTLKQGDKTWEFAYSTGQFRHFYVLNSELRVFIEQSAIIAYSGSNVQARFANFLMGNGGPFEFTYQLAEPVEIQLPSRVTPNTQELLTVSAQMQAFIDGDPSALGRIIQDKKTGMVYSWTIDVEDGIPIIKLVGVGN